jgi:hypothetical protein
MRIRILPFHFGADPDPAFALMRILIRLFPWMRIQLPKMMRINADWDPQQWYFGNANPDPGARELTEVYKQKPDFPLSKRILNLRRYVF